MALSVDKLARQLKEAGTRLLSPPSSVDELLPILDEVEICLEHVEQSPSKTMQDALSPLKNALVAEELLGHSDPDVKVSVATCINEITRITAPDAPYNDDQMKEIFHLIVSSFEKLDDVSSRSFKKRTTTLETVARVRSCVVMLDLECDTLILEMFQHFLKSVRDYHPETVFTSMETIMTLVLDESEDISSELLSPILEYLKKDNKNVDPVARRLGESVLNKCASKVKPYLVQAIKTLGNSLDDYSTVVASVCKDLSGAVELNGVNTASNNSANQADLPNPSSEGAVKEKKETFKDSTSQDEVSPAPDQLESTVSNGNLEKIVEEAEAVKEPLAEQNCDDHIENKDAEESGTSKVEMDMITKPLPKEKSNIKRGRKGNLPKHTVVEEAEVVKEDSREQNCDEHIEKVVAEESNISKIETGLIIKPPPNEESNEKSERKGNLTDSTLESSEATPAQDNDAEEATNFQESESKDDGSLQSEDTPAENKSAPNSDKEAALPHPNSEKQDDIPHPNSEKEADIAHPNSEKEANPHPSFKTSDIKAVDAASPSPSGDTTEESHRQILEVDQENKTEAVVQEARAIPEADSKKEFEADASGSKADKGQETSSAPDKEEKTLGPVDVSRKDDGISIVSDSKTTKLSSKKNESVSDQQNEKIKGQRKTSNMKDSVKPLPKKESKESDSSPKRATKSAKKEPPSAGSKRKHAGSKDKASEIDKHGEDLVGSKIEVWWPKDKEFYKGVVESFSSSSKKHTVLYTDGDVEVLNLEKEKWRFIKDDCDSDKGYVSDGENPDASSEIHKKKKIKTTPEPSNKQGNSVSANKKRVGGTSSSRSKVAVSKPGSKESNIKTSKDEDAKEGGGSEDEKVGISSNFSSGDESMDETPKGSGKSKEDDFKTPKAGTKAKQTGKGNTRSKGKTAKGNGSKSDAKVTGKAKISSSLSKGKESETTKKSQSETAKSSQSGKGKSSSTSSKAQKVDTKSGDKRKRGSSKK